MCNIELSEMIFEQLIDRGFDNTKKTRLAACHLAKKPDERHEALVDRMVTIRDFQEDTVGNSILAASYYGMEELRMRLPRLEETLVNPFGTGREVSYVSVPILMADGGPAEGAKAIGLYISLMKKGVDVRREAVLRLIGLLCVVSVNPMKTMADLEAMEGEGDPTTKYLLSGISHMEELLEDRQKQEILSYTAQSLLGEMRNEVETILEAIREDME